MTSRFRHAALALVALAACGHDHAGLDGGKSSDAGTPRGMVAWFRLDAGDWFSTPWPNDLARDDNGFVRLDGIPNPTRNTMIKTYVSQGAGRFDGFSTTGAIYVRFDGDLDASSIPGFDGGSGVALVDIDTSSPERGRHFPLQASFLSAGSTYWPSHTLAVAPAGGFPLRSHTRYALVLTRALHDADGGSIAPDDDLAAILAGNATTPAQLAAASVITPALDELTNDGFAREDIVDVAVFTTQTIGVPLLAAFAAQDAQPAPQQTELELRPDAGPFDLYKGHFGPVPVWQAGTPPYGNNGEGDFVLDGGVPVQQGSVTLAFTLAVPTSAMPANGFPIVVYAHGSGGSADSFFNEGLASVFTAQGLAVIGFDQPFAGERQVGAGGQLEGFQFYDFINPVALRGNLWTAALNTEEVARLVASLNVPASLSPSHGALVTFDVNHVLAMGHSQGTQGMAMWLAIEDQAHVAMLSGAGATPMFALTQNTPDFDDLALLAEVLGVTPDAPDLQPLSPLITLARTFTDDASPVSYADAICHAPRAGHAPKSLFMTMGQNDSYVTDPEIGALATGAKLQLVQPVPFDWPEWDLLGQSTAALPLVGNAANGQATCAWQEAIPPAGDDGHFVVFDIPELQLRVANYLGSGVRGVPTISP
ncbi:MAG: hypothetical protein JST54_34790 [Deltaproteobacteria bacterium]|nr:hypothetical protein [Deltaproteobacteria bacterium]